MKIRIVLLLSLLSSVAFGWNVLEHTHIVYLDESCSIEDREEVVSGIEDYLTREKRGQVVGHFKQPSKGFSARANIVLVDDYYDRYLHESINDILKLDCVEDVLGKNYSRKN